MRVKEKMLQDKDLAFKEDVSFAEWLDYFSNEPTEAELDAMEQELKIKSTLLPFKSINNPYYHHPLQGA